MMRISPAIYILALAFVSPSLNAAPLPKIRVAADGRHFQTASNQFFAPFGVTYYRPGTGWAPQVWKQFDQEATRRDFAKMKEQGVNCVRVFITYESFYKEAGALNFDGIRKFDRLLSIASEAGIYIHPTGPDHWEGLPEWAKTDRIADDKVLSALESFWRMFASRYRGRTVIFAYDLLNEPEVGWDTPAMRPKWNRWLADKYKNTEQLRAAWKRADVALESAPAPENKDAKGSRQLLDYQAFRESLANDWTRRQSAAIKSVDPDALVTAGLIQWSIPSCLPAVRHYAGFRPQSVAPYLDFMTVHFYPLNSGAYEYKDEAEESGNLAYLKSAVYETALAGKPVVIGEFGWYGGGKPRFDNNRHPFASEEQQAQWCRKVVETTSTLATGWLNWGFYDQPEATDVSQLTGLATHDGKIKAWGVEFLRLSKAWTAGSLIPLPDPNWPLLNWDDCITSTAAGNEYRKSLANK